MVACGGGGGVQKNFLKNPVHHHCGNVALVKMMREEKIDGFRRVAHQFTDGIGEGNCKGRIFRGLLFVRPIFSLLARDWLGPPERPRPPPPPHLVLSYLVRCAPFSISYGASQQLDPLSTRRESC